MQMRFDQTQKQTHTITQKLIQNVQVLQMTSQELAEYICGEALENPAIDLDRLELIERRTQPDYRAAADGEETQPEPAGEDPTDDNSLRQQLIMQLMSSGLGDTEYEMCRSLIDCVDSRGYLEENEGSVSELFGVDAETARSCLDTLRSFSPAGVCAEGLEQCLVLQLRARPDSELAIRIVEEQLDALSHGHYSSIAKRLHVTLPEVRAAAERIRRLNPIPSAGFDDREEILYSVPDVQVGFEEGRAVVGIRDSFLPGLQLSPYYQKLYETSADSEVKEYLDEKLKSAEWLIKCVAQREDTLVGCMAVVAELQSAFLSGASDTAAPMTLRDVAERMGVHVSTVSRTIRGKYVQCVRGVLPIKSLFSQTLGSVEEGARSGDEARAAISRLIAAEDKSEPLSDQQLSEALKSDGISISRRTVAKYREQLGIPGMFVRKK